MSSYNDAHVVSFSNNDKGQVFIVLPRGIFFIYYDAQLNVFMIVMIP